MMTMISGKFMTENFGFRLASTNSRKIVPIEFEHKNNLEQRYTNISACFPSKRRDLLDLHLKSTCTDTSRDNSPFNLSQAINFFDLVPPKPTCQLHESAIKLQKVYKSYRTRRTLADCAVVIEELWWRALDFAALKRSSISFFDDEKPETTASRWARARTRAAKVGKGLSKSDKAQKLALQHWLEAIDPRHRYGHNLQFYYDIWLESESTQPFFYWLDVGYGKEFSLKKCPRSILQQQCIKYLGPKERKSYEVTIKDGKLIYKLTELMVHTADSEKWIFVLSTYGALYVGKKKKGKFQHSSFLAGGATIAAGRLVVKDGCLKAIWPHSGHYLPTEENFKEFINFLEENNVDLTNVKTCAIDEDDRSLNHSSSFKMSRNRYDVMNNKAEKAKKNQTVVELVESTDIIDTEKLAKEHEFYYRNNINQPPLIESGEPLAQKWTTGSGPCIGCMREYSYELQYQALEQVNLSAAVTPVTWTKTPIPSPRPCLEVKVSSQLEQMHLYAPTFSPTLPKPERRT